MVVIVLPVQTSMNDIKYKVFPGIGCEVNHLMEFHWNVPFGDENETWISWDTTVNQLPDGDGHIIVKCMDARTYYDMEFFVNSIAVLPESPTAEGHVALRMEVQLPTSTNMMLLHQEIQMLIGWPIQGQDAVEEAPRKKVGAYLVV